MGEKLEREFNILGVFERGGILEFQPGKMKETLGFPGNDVMVDIIKADDILAS